MAWFLRKCPATRHTDDGSVSFRTSHVLSRHIAAAVNTAPCPDAHDVALPDSALDVEGDRRPALLAHSGLQQILRDIVRQDAALHVRRSRQGSRTENQGKRQ